VPLQAAAYRDPRCACSSDSSSGAGLTSVCVSPDPHCLLVLLRLQARASVAKLDVQLLRTLDDLLAVARGDVVGNLSRILAVLHEEDLELLDVVDGELEEAAGHAVARGLIGAIANVDQLRQALELAPLPRIDTARPAPAVLHLDKLVRLVALEAERPLLDNLLVPG